MPNLNIDKFPFQINEEYRHLGKFISPITNKDKDLYLSFFEKPKDEVSNNFENSFEYIRQYFNSGRYQGFKYYDNENLIVFALKKRRNRILKY
ncbi:MAG: hypothetical protein ACFFG0_16795 [Candidatus Thorarchaeota archaeon]